MSKDEKTTVLQTDRCEGQPDNQGGPTGRGPETRVHRFDLMPGVMESH